jgi:phage replication O-like protein O
MSGKIFEPNYTQVPNSLLDGMADLSEPELRVALVVCRQTFGWHREKAVMSITYLMQATGMSSPAVVKACRTLEEKGLLVKQKTKQFKGSNAYGLLINDLLTTLPGKASDLVTSLLGEGVSPGNDVTTNKERTLKERNPSPDGVPSPEPESEHQKFFALWNDGFKTRFDRPYKFLGGRDGKAVKELLNEPNATAADLMDVVNRAWEHGARDPKKFFFCSNLNCMWQIASSWNNIQAELSTTVTKSNPKVRSHKGGNL